MDLQAKLIIIDCDGVLTSGQVWYTSKGERSKGFNSRDIRAIRELIANGFQVIICTQSTWPGVQHFANRTGAEVIIAQDKPIPTEPFIMIGDDVPDIELMKKAELSFCPVDADEAVKPYCQVLHTAGGEGVISEVVKYLV